MFWPPMFLNNSLKMYLFNFKIALQCTFSELNFFCVNLISFSIFSHALNYNLAAHKKAHFIWARGHLIGRQIRTRDLRNRSRFFFLLISILIFELWLYPCRRTFQGILSCCRPSMDDYILGNQLLIQYNNNKCLLAL